MALQLPDQAIPQLREFVRGLNDKMPGVVLIGDGSATSPEQPIGWSCLLFEPARCTAYLLSGTVSFGTNNAAELQPYFQALLFHERLCETQERVPMRSVLIVSDSQVTVNCGNDQANPTANHSLWAAVNAFRRVRDDHSARNDEHVQRIEGQLQRRGVRRPMAVLAVAAVGETAFAVADPVMLALAGLNPACWGLPSGWRPATPNRLAGRHPLTTGNGGTITVVTRDEFESHPLRPDIVIRADAGTGLLPVPPWMLEATVQEDVPLHIVDVADRHPQLERFATERRREYKRAGWIPAGGNPETAAIERFLRARP